MRSACWPTTSLRPCSWLKTSSLALGPEIADLGVSGGAVYDALVGAAARQHQRPLVSADARARPVYEALGVELEMIRT